MHLECKKHFQSRFLWSLVRLHCSWYDDRQIKHPKKVDDASAVMVRWHSGGHHSHCRPRDIDRGKSVQTGRNTKLCLPTRPLESRPYRIVSRSTVFRFHSRSSALLNPSIHPISTSKTSTFYRPTSTHLNTPKHQKMNLTALLLTLLPALALSAPVGSTTDSALVPRQSSGGGSNNAGSTSTSTSNNDNTLFGGLTSCMFPRPVYK